MLRLITTRLYGFRRFHGFKRNIVPSDFDVENQLWCNDKYINKKEFENPGDKKGSELYYPKYGSSIYDDKIANEHLKNEIQERYNSRED